MIGAGDTFEVGRQRRAGLIVAAGAVVGVLGAIVSAVRGGSGRDGLTMILLLTALGAVVASTDAAVLMLVDQFRGRPSTWRRLALVLGLLLLAVILLGMIAGVATGG